MSNPVKSGHPWTVASLDLLDLTLSTVRQIGVMAVDVATTRGHLR